MAIPEIAMERIKRWAAARIPPHVRDQIRIDVKVRGKHVTVLECRPPWRPDMGVEWTQMRIAQLRYDSEGDIWALHWADRNGRWHPYDMVEPTPAVGDLLDEMDEDPTGIFWG